MLLFTFLSFISFMPNDASAQTCSQKIKEKLESANLHTGVFGVIGTAASISAESAAFLVHPVLFGASMAGTAAYYLAVTAKRHRILRILTEASSCQGKKISKFYNRYQSTVQNPLSMNEFCSRIHQSDQDGSLCAEHVVPSRNQMVRFIHEGDANLSP